MKSKLILPLALAFTFLIFSGCVQTPEPGRTDHSLEFSSSQTIIESSSELSSDFDTESSSDLSLESSFGIVSEYDPDLDLVLKRISDTIYSSLAMQDMVAIDQPLLESLTEITPELYVQFSGKISIAQDNTDLILILLCKEANSRIVVERLQLAKERLAQQYAAISSTLEQVIRSSLIVTENNYAVWVIAQDAAEAEEIIFPLLQ